MSDVTAWEESAPIDWLVSNSILSSSDCKEYIIQEAVVWKSGWSERAWGINFDIHV